MEDMFLEFPKYTNSFQVAGELVANGQKAGTIIDWALVDRCLWLVNKDKSGEPVICLWTIYKHENGKFRARFQPESDPDLANGSCPLRFLIKAKTKNAGWREQVRFYHGLSGKTL